ncbi:hypothetical protein RHS04_08975 [Rhizoctonia solani]|uniref:Uncharacterized protein n=1 Tax=Rhizoctonia solani TaxID=456999 RepID=A0A8H7GYW1_9AGAM|nr:hypothetical protein RHS04_08975 [Rhizoctonia solani]
MPQTTPSAPTGPISKRCQQRADNQRINTVAAEADAVLRAHIEEAASKLGVLKDNVFQRFALIAPIGEQRSAMWWNGLLAKKSSEWKDKYRFLPWVSHRIRNKGLVQDLTDEDKSRYAELATKTRAKNKDEKTASLTWKQVVALAQDELTNIHTQLETLRNQLGLQYMLVTTRGKLEDDMPPLYASSEKVDTFLQGHMNMPMKDLLTHLDFYVIGNESAGVSKIQNKKEALRSSVCIRLKDSLSSTIKGIGGDPSTVLHVKYKNYDKMVYTHGVVLVGYPVTPDADGRQMVRPSNFPGGIRGLMHADNQLASGAWRFEALPTDTYAEWKVKYKKAMAKNGTMPLAPYIPVPGSEYIKGPAHTPTAEDSGVSRKRKTSQVKPMPNARKANKKFKSRATIADSKSETPSELDLGDSDNNNKSTEDAGSEAN